MKRLALPLLIAATPVTGFAQDYDNLAKVDLLPGWRTEAGDHIAALQITLRPGWVTYWRSPGDGGIPPDIRFGGDATIESITPRWPTPKVFGENGMLSIGYYDGVTVPLEIDLSGGADAVQISGQITIGVCEEVCIPVTVNFDTLLPAIGASDPVITDALAQQPISANAAGVGTVSCTVDPIADGLQVTASITMPPHGTNEHVVIEAADPRVWVSEADVSRSGNTLRATVDMVHPTGAPFALDRSGMRLTVLGEGRAVDIQGCSAG